MEKTVDVRRIEEWMYAITSSLGELEPKHDTQSLALLQRTLDDMRECRAQLQLRRHNEVGY